MKKLRIDARASWEFLSGKADEWSIQASIQTCSSLAAGQPDWPPPSPRAKRDFK
jgi:hypothetical protein